MVVSLDNIPKGSLVYHFITSGKRGRCALCFKMVEKLEAHHVCYSPEKTIKLCHSCHHKVHFWPQRLSDEEKLKLLSKRFTPLEAIEMINKKMLGPAALAKLIAPSRNVFVRAEQFKAQHVPGKRTLRNSKIDSKIDSKSSHSPRVQKVNKPVDLSFIKRIGPGKLK